METSVAKVEDKPLVPTDNKLAIAANKIADIYLSDVSNLNEAVGMPMTKESKRCGVNAILYLCGDMGAAEVQKLPKEQLVQVLQFVTINGLDIFSGQVFLDKRWDKDKKCYSVKATPMGNAYEIMVGRFGVDVKKVHPAWVIHEGDEFTMPQHDGLKISPATWKQTLKGLNGKPIAVCYPIEHNSGDAEYVVSTREEVAHNLMAQILNAALRDQNVSRTDLMKEMEGKSLEDLLADENLAKYISPAYRSPSSREAMIIAKMKKNALLHYTRDLGNKAYAQVADEVDTGNDMVKKDVVAEADDSTSPTEATKVVDFKADDNGVIDQTPEKQETEPEEQNPEVVDPETPKADVKPAVTETTPVETSPKKEEEAKKDDGEPKIDFFNTGDLK